MKIIGCAICPEKANVFKLFLFRLTEHNLAPTVLKRGAKGMIHNQLMPLYLGCPCPPPPHPPKVLRQLSTFRVVTHRKTAWVY
jgi:hypothetical protein